ncbi:MAG: hypothetical protein M3177_05980, partial [Pseudomonadota bacterium]|nr:hypothetical protein [Pseudomonadota bacterium]
VASYLLVEQPLRRGVRVRPVRRRRVLALGGFALAGSALATALLFNAWPSLTLNGLGREAARNWEAPRPGCALRDSRRSLAGGFVKSWIPSCPGAREAPKLVAAGDSHAMSLEPSLRRYAAESARPVHLYARRACDLPSLSIPASAKPWCRDFYEAVVKDLSGRLAPGDVLLLSSLHLPRLGRAREQDPLNRRVRMGLERPAAYAEAAPVLARLARTGARIVIQAPLPIFPSPPLRCSQWFNRSNPVCAGGFVVQRDRLLELRRPTMEMMHRLARAIPNVEIWDPFPILCPRNPCSAFAGATPLFWDEDHLGLAGHDLLYPHLRRAVTPRPARP